MFYVLSALWMGAFWLKKDSVAYGYVSPLSFVLFSYCIEIRLLISISAVSKIQKTINLTLYRESQIRTNVRQLGFFTKNMKRRTCKIPGLPFKHLLYFHITCLFVNALSAPFKRHLRQKSRARKINGRNLIRGRCL